MYLKILNEKMNHHGFQYKEGLNIDTVPFNPKGNCEPGGLYYTDKENIFGFLLFGTLIADVHVPEDAQVYQSKHKWKADRIVLSNVRPVEEYIKSLSREEKFRILEHYNNSTVIGFRWDLIRIDETFDNWIKSMRHWLNVQRMRKLNRTAHS